MVSIANVHEARAALRAGDLIVEGSQRYAAWDSDLYQAKEWAERRDAWYEESGLPKDGELYLEKLLSGLDTHSKRVDRRIAHGKNLDVRVEEDKLVLTTLEKVEVPHQVLDVRADLLDRFPPTGVPELLLEVDHWTQFTRLFLHLTTRREPTEAAIAELRPLLFAVLVAEATNLGLFAMAQSSGIALHELERVYDWYPLLPQRHFSPHPVITTVTAVASTLTWTGEIPPQKWRTFYTKLLTGLVNASDLTLRLTMETSPKEGFTAQRIEAIKATLRELGLPDRIETE